VPRGSRHTEQSSLRIHLVPNPRYEPHERGGAPWGRLRCSCNISTKPRRCHFVNLQRVAGARGRGGCCVRLVLLPVHGRNWRNWDCVGWWRLEGRAQGLLGNAGPPPPPPPPPAPPSQAATRPILTRSSVHHEAGAAAIAPVYNCKRHVRRYRYGCRT